MAGGFGQYLKDTRGELKHVAWPTRTQTIVYAVLVAAISIGIALYLGLFDFLFTTGLSRLLAVLPHAAPQTVSTTTPNTSGNPITITQKPATSTSH